MAPKKFYDTKYKKNILTAKEIYKQKIIKLIQTDKIEFTKKREKQKDIIVKNGSQVEIIKNL